MRVPPPVGVALLDEISPRVRPDDPSLAVWCEGYLKDHRRRFGEDLALADLFTPPGTSILELGSVPPLITAALARTGRAVIGVDIAPDRFKTCITELGLDVRPCDFETEPLPFEDGAFDAVMMNEVFEHLRIDLFATMREVHRVLRPGGHLLLSTPNMASARGYANLLLRDRCWAICADPAEEYAKLDSLGHMGHVREYTPTEMATFLRAVGFSVDAYCHRGEPGSRWERLVTTIRPRLLPFLSIIATR